MKFKVSVEGEALATLKRLAKRTGHAPEAILEGVVHVYFEHAADRKRDEALLKRVRALQLELVAPVLSELGLSNREIAKRLGVYSRKVDRALKNA